MKTIEQEWADYCRKNEYGQPYFSIELFKAGYGVAIKESDRLKAENARLNDELKKYTHLERIEHGRFVAESLKVENLRKENARLREALQIYANDDVIGTVARKALNDFRKGGE